MKKRNLVLLILISALTGYRLYYSTRILGIHQTSDHIVVLVVEHFPWTKQGKIIWWENNREKIFNSLGFKQKSYTIYIYDTHYKKDSGTDEDSDLRCFQEMNTDKNCISKENRPLLVWHDADGHTEYETENIFQRFFRHF